MSVSTFGHLRIEAYLQLPVAFRSLSRPSSAPDAKAFTLCSYALIRLNFLLLSSLDLLLNCLSFLNIFFGLLILVKRFYPFALEFLFPPFGEIVILPKLERPIISLLISLKIICPLICSFLTLQYSLFGFQ